MQVGEISGGIHVEGFNNFYNHRLNGINTIKHGAFMQSLKIKLQSLYSIDPQQWLSKICTCIKQ